MEIQYLLKGWDFLGGSDSKVNDLSANAGEVGSIPRLGRPLGKEMATHSSILAWETAWT